MGLGDVVDVPPTELLEDFFVKIGGLIMLSLDDDDLLLGSVASISCTFLLTYAASMQWLLILCSNAVVELVLKRPRALRRNPWLKHDSTAPQRDTTVELSSCTNFFVTLSSIICLTSFFTLAINRSLNSTSDAEIEKIQISNDFSRNLCKMRKLCK